MASPPCPVHGQRGPAGGRHGDNRIAAPYTEAPLQRAWAPPNAGVLRAKRKRDQSALVPRTRAGFPEAARGADGIVQEPLHASGFSSQAPVGLEGEWGAPHVGGFPRFQRDDTHYAKACPARGRDFPRLAVPRSGGFRMPRAAGGVSRATPLPDAPKQAGLPSRAEAFPNPQPIQWSTTC